MGQSSFGDVCDASLPQTSQKWYQLCQAIFSGLETAAIVLFIYIHRKSKYLHQTIPKSPFNNNDSNNFNNYYNEYDAHHFENDSIPDIDSDDGNIIREEIIIQPSKRVRHSVDYGYHSPKLSHNNDSPLSKSFDSCDNNNMKLTNFILEDQNNIDTIYDSDNNEEYYNESQNRYYKMGYDDIMLQQSKKPNLNLKKRISFRKHKKHSISSSSSHNGNGNNRKIKNKRLRRETLTIIESNTDNYRIFCILLPIYYKFLGILCIYCIYRMIYMIFLYHNIGLIVEIEKNPFNNEYTYINIHSMFAIIGFGLFECIESCINHIITFWFLQPSSGFKSLKIAFIPAFIIGIIDAIITIYAIIDISNRKYLLILHILMLIFYILIFFYMILHQNPRWRLFYFYIIFFLIAYILYTSGDIFVIVTDGKFDGCMDELSQIMFSICIPIILALLLFDDSSYWLQLLTNLQQTNDENNKNNNTLETFSFNRVIDQLSMTIPVIKKSELEMQGDNNTCLIGCGSYSLVKKAKIIKTNEFVAIKALYIFNDENYKYVIEYMREACLSQRLKHHNIVSFKGVLIDKTNNNNSLCLVYEYMTHGSLFEYLTKNKLKYENIGNIQKYYKSISLALRIKFAIDSAKGIAFLHENNIIHRDINCRNLLITNDGANNDLIVKVCDFGTCRQISKNIGVRASLSYTTINESINTTAANNNNNNNKQMTIGCGTVAYMAPEILKYIDFSKKLKRELKTKKIEYDFSIDVFSFGGCLYEIMASKELYENLKTSKDVQDFVLLRNREKIHKNVMNILNIPHSYCELMNQCWSHFSADRPHFKDIIIRLQKIADRVQQQSNME